MTYDVISTTEPFTAVSFQEKNKTLQRLEDKAVRLHRELNSIEGITCNEVEGAMYAFPKLELPQKAVEEAKVG